MKTFNKFQRQWKSFFLTTGSLLFFVVFILLLLYDKQDNRLLTNRWLFVAALLTFSIIGVLYFFTCKEKTRPFLSFTKLVIIYGLLFLLQIFLVNRTYFYTGWDVSLMRFRLEHILQGGSMYEVSGVEGFSICPNNLFLFYVLYLVQKVALLFSVRQPYLFCLYSSCFSVTISCFIGNFIMRRLTENNLIHLLYMIASTLFILFSPWIVIPYSDTFGMLFVTFGLWAMICLQRTAVKWAVLSFSSIVGYMIKPSCLFPLFAALILYLPQLLVSIRVRWKEVCILTASILFFSGINYITPIWIQHTFFFKLNPELRLSYPHYMMMGLNRESSGSFSGEDYLFSVSIPTLKEREQANWEMIQYRLNSFTREELSQFFINKLLWNFNDGTFAWAYEGNFFEVQFNHDSFINDLYLETFHPDGDYYQLYRTVAQSIWLWILLGIPFLFWSRESAAGKKALLLISVSGLLVFLLIFEARARYLYLYSPVFLILSLCGYEGIYKSICDRVRASVHDQVGVSFPSSNTTVHQTD